MGDLLVKPAQHDELPRVMGVLDEAAALLQARGIAQWPSPQPPLIWAVIEREIARGQVYLARVPPEEDPIGTLRFTWSDRELWPQDPEGAGYVHHLAIRNHVWGYGIGAALLEWAQQQIRQHPKRHMRLDCWGENPALCRYYERLGFTFCGHARQGDYLAALYQREV